MTEMCWCHGACVFDEGGKNARVRETMKRISPEYERNVLLPWSLRFGCGGKMSWVRGSMYRVSRENREMCQCHCACFLNVGRKKSWVRETYEVNIVRRCGKCTGAIMPAFWMWGKISSVRERIKRIC